METSLTCPLVIAAGAGYERVKRVTRSLPADGWRSRTVTWEPDSVSVNSTGSGPWTSAAVIDVMLVPKRRRWYCLAYDVEKRLVREILSVSVPNPESWAGIRACCWGTT